MKILLRAGGQSLSSIGAVRNHEWTRMVTLSQATSCGRDSAYCFSYSPLPSFLRTVKPAFFASEMETGFSFIGELNVESTLRTGLRQAGQWVNGAALSGRRSAK